MVTCEAGVDSSQCGLRRTLTGLRVARAFRVQIMLRKSMCDLGLGGSSRCASTDSWSTIMDERPPASIPICGHYETSEVRRYRDPVSAGRCGREVFTQGLADGKTVVLCATEVLPPQSHPIAVRPIHPPNRRVVQRVRRLSHLIGRIPVKAVVMIEVCC